MAVRKKHSMRNLVMNSYSLAMLILFVIVFSMLSSRFLHPLSLINIIRVATPSIMLAGVITLLLISGNIDLSVGSTIGLSAVLYAIMTQHGYGFGISFLAICVLGVILGVINGFLVMKLRIISVIATIATMKVYAGVARLLVPKGKAVIKGGLPDDFSYIGRGELFGLPLVLYISIILAVVFIIVQRKTVLGKYAVAIGGNQEAARLSGINVTGTVWLLYIIAGLLAALAGLVRASHMAVGDPAAGGLPAMATGVELTVLVAVLLGGTSFFGGEGSVLRSIVGVLTLATLASGMYMVGIPPFWQQLVTGSVLIVGVVLFRLTKETISE